VNATQVKQDNVMMELAQVGITPSLEIQLKAERVQEPASFQEQEQQSGVYLYGLSVQPAQPVTIEVIGTAAVFILHGPGSGTSPGEAS
jgi:hypothetical protein